MLAGDDLRAVQSRLVHRLDAYLADLEGLINVDSGTADKEGNDLVGELLRTQYTRLGGQVTVHAQAHCGDISQISFEGSGKGTVLLLGHTDTVYPRGTAAQRPFRAEGERAFGPGAADMKSGDLLIVYALEALFASGWRDFGRIEIIHNSDEETGSPYSHGLIRDRSMEADVVLVLEAARENGDIVSARKGIAAGEVVVRGVPAHAGVNHKRGKSAALELAHIVIALERLNGQFPGVTLNVGKLEAGGPVNVVPDMGRAWLEMRATTIGSLQDAISHAEAVVAQRTVSGTEASIQVKVGHYPMHKSPAGAALVDLAKRIAGDLGFALSDTATGGGSDGNTAASAGRPVLDGLGPIGGSAHNPHEYLFVPSVAPRCALLAGLIAAIGSGSWAHAG